MRSQSRFAFRVLLPLALSLPALACSPAPEEPVGAAQAAPAATEQARLLANDGANDQLFGTSVAISGDTALVGAPFSNDLGMFSGSVYVFVRSGGIWSQREKLLKADGAAGELFGHSVALSGDTALIGVARGNIDPGTDLPRLRGRL